MNVVKKNLLSILCGVVALLAVVALVWPLEGMNESARAELKKQKETYEAIESLSTKQRKLPVFTIEAGEEVPLEAFPTPEITKKGEEASERMKEQGEGMVQKAREVNEKAPLFAGSLDRLRGTEAAEFRDRYLEVIRNELPAKVLKAGEPPTEEDRLARAEAVWFGEVVKLADIVDDQVTNQEDLEDLFRERTKKLTQTLREEKAQAVRMYIVPGALVESPAVTEGETPEPDDVWFAQLALWVQQDVCLALARANDAALSKLKEDDRNVQNAPVKHLIRLELPHDISAYVVDPQQAAMMQAAAAGGEATAEGEAAAAETNAAGLPVNYTTSPTGRVSNAMYDPVNFTLVVRVDARRVPEVLQELERNQFLTVTQVEARGIDPAAETEVNDVLYGNAPVVELDVRGEALFLRGWTEPLMPEGVARLLNVGGEAEATTEEPAAPG